MNIQSAYNSWSRSYDEVVNKTRDLEAFAFRHLLSGRSFRNCLEIGCGTGKNTAWLIENADHITAVDLSEEMLNKAKSKLNSPKVNFVQTNITNQWHFSNAKYDLITFSLVLEHISDLNHIFHEVKKVLSADGIVYIGELHPFKQYSGSKARFETESGTQVVECYNHHISEFIECAIGVGLKLNVLKEYFDDENNKEIPRILALIFTKI